MDVNQAMKNSLDKRIGNYDDAATFSVVPSNSGDASSPMQREPQSSKFARISGGDSP